MAVSSMSLVFTVRHGKSQSTWSGSILSLKILSPYYERNSRSNKKSLFSCYFRFAIRPFAILPKNTGRNTITRREKQIRSDIFIYIVMKKKSVTLRNWLSLCHPHNIFISYVGYSKSSQNYTNCTRNWSLVVS